jgi:hypothetical protein
MVRRMCIDPDNGYTTLDGVIECLFSATSLILSFTIPNHNQQIRLIQDDCAGMVVSSRTIISATVQFKNRCRFLEESAKVRRCDRSVNGWVQSRVGGFTGGSYRIAKKESRT